LKVRFKKNAVCIADPTKRLAGNKFSHLRCTLMGFERNYQVKILSNQIIQRRLFSILPTTNKFIQLIEPWFITGFTDAEGCFLVIIRSSKKNKLG
jgi:hypothetical protein